LTITNNLAKTVGFLEELESEKIELEKKLKYSEETFEQKQDEKEELEKQLSALRRKELEERTFINGVKDKIEFLQSLINNLEGVSKGAKILIESDGWTEKQKNLLADVGDAAEDYKFALEAALKNVLNNLLVEDINDLQKAVSHLTDNDLGKASFYVLDINPGNKKTFFDKVQNYIIERKKKKLEKEPSFLGWAESFIITEDKWKPYFRKLLGKTILTKDLNSAFELNNKYPEFNFATLSGDFIHKNGIVDAGSLPKLDDTLFGRKLLLENLRKEFPKYEVSLSVLKNDIQITEEKVDEIDLKEYADKNRILINDLANIEKQIAQFEFEKKKSSDEIEKIRAEIQELALSSNNTDNEISKLKSELEVETEKKKKAEEILKGMENDVKTIESEYTNIVSAHNQMKLELERSIGERKNLENAINRAVQSKETIKKSIVKRESDIEITAREVQTLTEDIDDNYYEHDELESVRKKLVTVESEIEKRLEEVRSQASVLEKQFSDFRRERDKVSDDIQSYEIKMNEINLKTGNLINYIKDNYSLTLELKEFDDLGTFNFEQRSDEVQSYKQQLKNLGPINLLAYSEYEEEKERLDFLQKQRDDLINSEKDLIKTIEEINVTAQTLFMETFQNIRDNFIKIFRTLFNPGDEADLKLEENVDPLEAKIEIVAKPKGKRPTSIELLSGGEKTLTATALLFAIYLVKPSPFCILDEVDAPLDDANVDRFTRIITEFSKSTQFIIVTHNKRTMEAAETLYGVTIQEEGVSKLVSVRFNEELSAFAK
jgi:chromosome segregation protein